MTEEKNNNGLKVVLGILIALLLGSGAFMFKMNSDANQVEETLTKERNAINDELNVMIAKTNELSADKKGLQSELEEERKALIEMKDSLNDSKLTVESLMRYKSRYLSLKKDHDDLLFRYDKLDAEHKNLQATHDIALGDLQNQRAVNDSLSMQNAEQANTIIAAKELSITALSGTGLIVKSSGKQTPTDKARRVDQVKICFAIPGNKIADQGDREYYIQVIDPKRNVIGEKETVNVGGKSLTYSAKTKFFYQNKTLDVCEYIAQDKFEKGTYVVNIFDNEETISSMNFSLK